MDYRERWKEENESAAERFALASERIRGISEEDTVQQPFRDYFRAAAQFLAMTEELYRLEARGDYRNLSLEQLEAWNCRLYGDILKGRYEASYASPVYASEKLGAEYGPLLAFLYTELRDDIVFAHECRLMDMTILRELFVEIYNQFEGEAPKAEEVKDTLYWFFSDYADRMVPFRLREQLDPDLSFGKDIVMESDLSDLRYLYFYGEYVSEEDRQMAAFLNRLPEEEIVRMADAYTEGYRKGFEVTGRDLSRKKTVSLLYELGFERMARQAVKNFRAMGLEPILYRSPVWSSDKTPNRKRGFHGTSPNRQMEYDHRYDQALYLTKAYTERKLAVLKVAYEACKDLAAVYGGPALIETFGEEVFHPENRPQCLAFSAKQEKLSNACAGEAAQIANAYIPGEETSFTIIAFPRPSIGPEFEEIFRETVRINTLDYEVYKTVQQAIIDRLDQAEYLVITGKGENRTRLKVMLHRLEDPARQTNFENCVADVNIPVGEVFTSPVLEGTEGLLQVGSVYIGEICFRNLRMQFDGGWVTDYGCDNFPDPEQGRALVRQVILKNHDSLPMGECAIGTNTAAYAMARRFGIIDKLPILIAEKMGPHFAVGDTCYSWSEDTAVYNPDGKEIIARDNEVSLQRKEDLSKAYFNCHTDITLPYPELDEIYGVSREGEKLPILSNGRFAVPGTEMLNRQLDEQKSNG